jgi:hypothetical protein
VRRLNGRRIKLHRNYLVEEVAMVFKVHKNTVRAWLKSGLEPIDGRRPTLILGRALSAFLHARRRRVRQPCRLGQFYCMRCRAPKTSANCAAEYRPITSIWENLKGTCSDCGTRMYRRVSLLKIPLLAGVLQVALPQGQLRIADTACPSLNSDFVQEPETYANAQSGK